MYFIISIINTNTREVQITDRIKRYIKSELWILKEKTDKFEVNIKYKEMSIVPPNISIIVIWEDFTTFMYLAFNIVNKAAKKAAIIP